MSMGMEQHGAEALAALSGPGFVERLCADILGMQRPLQCAQVEISSFCAGKCGYCPHTTEGAGWPARHMSAECFARLWPILRRSARAHLQGWGEPMLHPLFSDFVAAAARAGCRVSSTSCGLAINERNAPLIAASGLDMLAISLAGTDEASNAIRNGVPFERVCLAIGQLNRAIAESGSSLQIHLAYLLLADRLDAVARLPGLMRAHDVPVAVVSTLDFIARPEHRALAITPDNARTLDLARKMLEIAAAQAADDGRLIHYSLPGAAAHPASCREGVDSSLYVSADGLISPCVYLNVPGMAGEKRLVFGDMTQRDAWEIWNDDAFVAFRRGLPRGECPAACATCVKRHEAES